MLFLLIGGLGVIAGATLLFIRSRISSPPAKVRLFVGGVLLIFLGLPLIPLGLLVLSVASPV
jgi:hypothetical protein